MCPFRVYKHKKLAAISVAAVLCMASFGVFAATEHWNDASLTPKVTTKTSVSDNTDWQQWKDNWNQTKTQFIKYRGSYGNLRLWRECKSP